MEQNYSIIAGLCAAIAALWKIQESAYRKAEVERKEAVNNLINRHVEEEKDLKKELKCMHDERKEERKEWLCALDNNTEQLKNVADKLQVIPNLQADMDCLKSDMQLIKNNFKTEVTQ